MEIPIPVGCIALLAIGWELYEYRDWVGPIGIARLRTFWHEL